MTYQLEINKLIFPTRVQYVCEVSHGEERLEDALDWTILGMIDYPRSCQEKVKNSGEVSKIVRK